MQAEDEGRIRANRGGRVYAGGRLKTNPVAPFRGLGLKRRPYNPALKTLGDHRWPLPGPNTAGSTGGDIPAVRRDQPAGSLHNSFRRSTEALSPADELNSTGGRSARPWHPSRFPRGTGSKGVQPLTGQVRCAIISKEKLSSSPGQVVGWARRPRGCSPRRVRPLCPSAFSLSRLLNAAHVGHIR